MAPPLSLSPCKQLSACWDSGEETYVLLSPAWLKPCCLSLMRCARFAALVSCALAGSSALALGWVRLRHRELPASRKGWGRTLYLVSPFGLKGLLWPPTIAAKALRYSSKSHPPTTEKYQAWPISEFNQGRPVGLVGRYPGQCAVGVSSPTGSSGKEPVSSSRLTHQCAKRPQ
jgi:hypothetical protein